MKKVILFILLSLFTFSFTTKSSYKNTNIERVDTTFLTRELNDSVLYLALLHYEVKEPKIVLAQAKLESGNFTSNLFINKNNFLGLYNSRKKEFFEFNHWSDCIKGYKNMIEYKLKDGENYYDFLKRIGYAEDPDYIAKVKRIEKGL